MKNLAWFLLAFAILLLDQISKAWAVANLGFYETRFIFPMFNLTLAHNSGAAFSFLSGTGYWHHWFFVLFSGTMAIFLIIWLLKIRDKPWQSMGLSLILGGAVGNLYDRLSIGQVVDFLDLHYKHYHWPIFNLADSAICLGAILLCIDLCKHPRG